MKFPLRGNDVQGGDCWKKKAKRKMTETVAEAVTMRGEGPASQQMAAEEGCGGGATGEGAVLVGKVGAP